MTSTGFAASCERRSRSGSASAGAMKGRPCSPWRDGVGARHSGLHADLRLTNELVAAVLALHLAREELVRDDERVVIAGLHRELFEVLGELLVGALRANQLDGDLHGVGIATDVGEALERAAESARALGAVARVEPPLLQLAGDDALPTELVAERDVRVADAGARPDRRDR